MEQRVLILRQAQDRKEAGKKEEQRRRKIVEKINEKPASASWRIAPQSL
jgi:hypothetical protein